MGDQYRWPTAEKWGVKFVVIVVDYFTKWVKVEALATITMSNIKKFL
jgi:hypothetical protein